MAKNLPYFKFYSSEWNDGDITLEDMKTQGVFINICSYYWSQDCDISFQKLQKRFKNCAKQIKNLIESEIIYKDLENIKIKFLDIQYEEREVVKHRNKANGLKGGRPKITQSVNSGLGENNPKLTNIEVEENKNKNKKRREESIKGSNESPLLETSISPEDIKERPYNRMVLDYMEIYKKIKSFSEQEVFGKIQHALHEAVNNCGTAHLMQTVNDYAYYMSDQPKEKGFASSPVNWLTNRQYNTDWLMRTEGCYTSHTIPDALVDAFSKRSTKHPDMKWEN